MVQLENLSDTGYLELDNVKCVVTMTRCTTVSKKRESHLTAKRGSDVLEKKESGPASLTGGARCE